MQDLAVEYVALGSILPYARNSRTHSAAQVEQIAASIREFGFCNPVLMDHKGTIIAGHGRVLAAKLLRLETVPVIRLGHLTETQRKAYVLVDNQIATNAGWNPDLLRLELKELQAVGFDMPILAFGDGLPALMGFESEPPPPPPIKDGAKELDEGDFQEFAHNCPKCGFGFD
ncbi:MAG: ParB/Srx family N-terminal domain-containing protein [Pseudomonadota bacterium]